jgi:hypothetical protein
MCVVPGGTCDVYIIEYPALKRWAIGGHSYNIGYPAIANMRTTTRLPIGQGITAGATSPHGRQNRHE